jgi:hypothetical protein
MKRYNYRQAIVKSKDHLILSEGQIVNIVDEEGEDYWVRATFDNSPKVRIAKKDLETN